MEETSNNINFDINNIKYENKNEIINILKKLMQFSQLLEEWNKNNILLNQEIMKKSIIYNKTQVSNSFLLKFHEILLNMYSLKTEISTKINNINYQDKEELNLTTDIFETISVFIEMFEKEYSLKETIIADILNRTLKKEELETNYSLITNEPYIDYENLTTNLKNKNLIYQLLINSVQ
ncbi:hypothetical protein BCR32DRAFT_242740 [Anaeromyces robustus]|uniref:Uncharacterized protein n=1 Tax=Anaeromyces robustus TaxID=1754192 RepID=A0A1Y1XEM9_9FUNG|nr:hypothetical protein BCR32DRAFT_242740 [Anaeromyces robustus]|eukprot:ORX84231.1 hypothetical protein BCR32DRAFT_242740 [Anaeromyces robustus]